MRGLLLACLTAVCLTAALCPLPAAPASDKPAGQDEAAEPARLGTARFLNVGRVFSLAYARDGKLLAAGAWDGSIRVWELASAPAAAPTSAKQRWQLQGHRGPVDALAFSPDGKLLVSGGRESGVCLWSLETGQLVRRLGADKASATMVAFAPDGKQVGGIVRGAFHLWDAATGSELWQQGGDRIHRQFAFLGPASLTSISIQPVKRFHDQLVPQAESHLDIASWDLQTRKERRPSRQWKPVLLNRDLSWPHLDAPTAMSLPARSIAYVHSQSYSSGESDIRILDMDTQQLVRQFKVIRQEISVLCLSPDGRMLATTGNPLSGDGANRPASYILIWDAATGRERCRFRSPDEGKTTLAFAPDCRNLASGSLDTTVLLWDLTGQAARRDKNEKPAPVQLTAKDLDSLWHALKSDDAPVAYRAIWRLAAAPRDAVPFFAEHLRPVADADTERIQRLIGDLGDERFEVREKASRALAGYQQLAEPALGQALQKANVLEVRRRIEQLLEKLQSRSAEQLQEARAVEAMERMQTPEAEKLLRHLATGAAAAFLTREAHAALARMQASKAP